MGVVVTAKLLMTIDLFGMGMSGQKDGDGGGHGVFKMSMEFGW